MANLRVAKVVTIAAIYQDMAMLKIAAHFYVLFNHSITQSINQSFRSLFHKGVQLTDQPTDRPTKWSMSRLLELLSRASLECKQKSVFFYPLKFVAVIWCILMGYLPIRGFLRTCAGGKFTPKRSPQIKKWKLHVTIGMCCVYPEEMAWNNGAVHSDFNLGECIWRSGPQRANL